jgi:hypothetical protein
MRQLIRLYEEIWDDTFDRRNFVKKINQLDILEKLEEKEKHSSRRGAHFYQFNEKKYREKVERGATFIAGTTGRRS